MHVITPLNVLVLFTCTCSICELTLDSSMFTLDVYSVSVAKTLEMHTSGYSSDSGN